MIAVQMKALSNCRTFTRRDMTHMLDPRLNTFTSTYNGDPDVDFDPAPATDESLFEILIAVAESYRRHDFADEFRRRAHEAKSQKTIEQPEPTPVIREVRQ